MTRTYTPEAIAALVKAARAISSALVGTERQKALVEALRPFTTEPSSWAAFARELWGEAWTHECDMRPGLRFDRVVTSAAYDEARAAYRARYGVEP